MFQAPDHPTLILPYEPVRLDVAPTLDQGRPAEGKLEGRLAELASEVEELQGRLYADGRWALLVVFQGRDASGKDGTIRRVFQQTSPTGVRATAFGPPSNGELAHDFLWRTARHLPERGHIGIFNRSYYEEVLVPRVHPEYLRAQRLPDLPADGGGDALWEQRLESIRDHELHLARSGTAIVKLFLHLSREEQRQRFLARLNEPDKHWKFTESDIRARDYWDAYTEAYEAAINATTRPWAPWHVVPADDKGHLRLQVAEVIVGALRALGLRTPRPSFDRPIEELRALLEAGDSQPG